MIVPNAILQTTVSRTHTLSDTLVSVACKKNQLVCTGRLSLADCYPIKFELALVDSHSHHLSLHPVSFHPNEDRAKRTKEKTFLWTWSLNTVSFVKKLLVEQTPSTSLHAHLVVHVKERSAPLVFAVSFPRKGTHALLKEYPVSYGKTTALLSTSASADGFLEVTASFFPKDTYAKARQYSFPLVKKSKKGRVDTWIMGHSPNQIGKMSWSLFLAAQERYPDKALYYVLDPAAPEWATAFALLGDRLLAYGSKLYFQALFQATLIVSEQAPYHLFPSASLFWEKRIPAKRLVAPSYPLGLSNERYTLNQQTVPWRIDSLLVGSKTEARFAKDTLGLTETQICLAPLPSMHTQEDSKKTTQKMILLVPAAQHLKWHSQQEALPSPLLHLCTDPQFIKWIADNHFHLVVELPEENNEVKNVFENIGVATRVASVFHDEDWMLRATVLITDIHPSALTRACMEKPVLFYQPPAYLSFSTTEQDLAEHVYQNELPGETGETPAEIVHLLSQLKKQQYHMSRKNKKKGRMLREFPPHAPLDQTFACLEFVAGSQTVPSEYPGGPM